MNTEQISYDVLKSILRDLRNMNTTVAGAYRDIKALSKSEKSVNRLSDDEAMEIWEPRPADFTLNQVKWFANAIQDAIAEKNR